jgi:hypothetical protein
MSRDGCESRASQIGVMSAKPFVLELQFKLQWHKWRLLVASPAKVVLNAGRVK